MDPRIARNVYCILIQGREVTGQGSEVVVISASWKQRQKDHYKVEANLVCLAKVRQPELQIEVLVQLTVSLLRAYG